MYHFISGYTAKVAGTERGVTKPTATFSPCFGGPFLTLHPLKYAKLLKQKMNSHSVLTYLDKLKHYDYSFFVLKA